MAVTCLDCGEPIPDDGALIPPDLCPDCAHVAITLLGTVDARVRLLRRTKA